MSLNHHPESFRKAPLITPDRIRENWQEALALRPEWASFAFPLEDSIWVMRVGKKNPVSITMPSIELALLCEVTRFKASVATNTNGSGPGAKTYVKVTLSNATEDNVTVRRLFSGAVEGEEVRALWVESDYSATNAYFAPSGKAKKAARDMVRYHLKRAFREKVAPDGFHKAAYLANIEALFAEIDATLGGGESA